MIAAEEVWKAGLCALLAVVVTWGVFDLSRWLLGRQTLSMWLRLNPSWYWWPAGLLVGGVILLGIHLFVLPKLMGWE